MNTAETQLLSRMSRELADAKTENERLQAIIVQLDTTEDGVLLVPGTKIYHVLDTRTLGGSLNTVEDEIVLAMDDEYGDGPYTYDDRYHHYYSTPELALAAYEDKK